MTEGDHNNRLRSEPNTGTEKVGEILAGNVIDRILAGPACGEGYVWWLVEHKGIQGWTVESEGSDYYLEPLPEFVYTATPIPSPTLTSSPTWDPNIPTLTPTFTITPTLTPLPQEFVCESDFGGALPPKLQIGDGTAIVTEGNLGNRLRNQPSTEGEQVGFVDSGTPIDRVIAGPACSDGYVWWLIEEAGVQGWTVEATDEEYFLEPMPGFASTSTPSLTPSITATLRSVPARGTPTATVSVLASPTLAFLGTQIPQDAICPADFKGYLVPRIRIGLETAKVSEGLRNRLRADPNTDGKQVGFIESGAIIDVVLTGPVCADGYVWWLVENAGIQGWTAESNEDEYFLEPLGASLPTPTATFAG